MLSFLSLRKPFQMRPSASTTSSPSVSARALPYPTTPTPPALVARFPPIVQLPSDARLRGKSRSAFSAASCTVLRVTPASTVIVLSMASTSRMLLSRTSERTTSLPISKGICPPTAPVLPPCATMAVRVSLAMARMRDTSSTLAGFSTACALPTHRSRHSLR